MNEKELYQQKFHAQLEEWRADIDKLRAKADGVRANAQLIMEHQIEALEARFLEAQSKLDTLTGADDRSWENARNSVETAWDSLEYAVNDAIARY